LKSKEGLHGRGKRFKGKSRVKGGKHRTFNATSTGRWEKPKTRWNKRGRGNLYPATGGKN